MQKINLVRGVGVNDSDYPVSVYAVIGGRKKRLWRCKFYTVWSNMIARCYSAIYQEKHPTYDGCSVASEWLTFSVFRAWMLSQDHDGKELDKDILHPGNKVYGPDTCVLVPGQINNFIIDSGAARGEWPIGVSWCKDYGKFLAQCNNPFTGKRENLGYFIDPSDGHEAWRKRKHELACRYADMQTDPRIAAALRTRYAGTEKESYQ